MHDHGTGREDRWLTIELGNMELKTALSALDFLLWWNIDQRVENLFSNAIAGLM